MVYLNRIYTKTGDEGETSLGDGTRVSKTHPRVIAYGSVDELNASLGVVLAVGTVSQEHSTVLKRIQNDLFDLGADLCVPDTATESLPAPLRITSAQVHQLEQWIDASTAQLSPLKSFILPGGTPEAALLHQARTICRRSEIEVLQLTASEPVNPRAVIYLNRLSDLLFVMARMANDQGRSDILWKPGGDDSQSCSTAPKS